MRQSVTATPLLFPGSTRPEITIGVFAVIGFGATAIVTAFTFPGAVAGGLLPGVPPLPVDPLPVPGDAPPEPEGLPAKATAAIVATARAAPSITTTTGITDNRRIGAPILGGLSRPVALTRQPDRSCARGRDGGHTRPAVTPRGRCEPRLTSRARAPQPGQRPPSLAPGAPSCKARGPATRAAARTRP